MTKPTANGNLELVSLAMPPRLGNEGGPSPKNENTNISIINNNSHLLLRQKS